MAQDQPSTTANHGMRPTTPQTRTPLKIPRLSPSRMPEQLINANSIRNGHLNLDTFSPVNQNGSFEFDRVIKSGRVLRRTKKKGAWKPSWKPTYLVLRPNLLSIYNNVDETELRASITLSDVTAVARVKKTNTQHVFGVFTPAKNYHFSCINEGVTSEWVSLLRIESGAGGDEELDLVPPPPPGFPANQHDNPGSESTDLSAEDELEPPGSPEMPQWSVRGTKSRGGSTSNRKPSNLREHSGNEAFSTSQSDLSDALPPNGPYQSLSSSISKSKIQLEPIPDGDPLSTSRPSFQRSTSQLSIGQMQFQNQQTTSMDPNRVIRQSNILLLKSVPGTGVRQWKSVWMVLRPTSLALYKSSNEYEPLKIIQVADLIDAAEIDPVSKSKIHCLQIIGLEKTWRFCVDNESQLDGWLGALKSVFNKRGRGRGKSIGQLYMQGQPIQNSSLNQNPHATINLGGPLQASATGQSAFQPVQSVGINKNVGNQHQRPESVLDGIVEATEEMTVH